MKAKPHSRYSLLTVAILSLVLSGCAAYHAHPLPVAPDLMRTPQLTVPAKQFALPGLAPHCISPRGLDVTTVVLLAVSNDPDLKAARLQAGVARAQMLEARLLPDPQLSAGFATSATNYGGDLGLSQDIQALITRGAARATAKTSAQQVNLNILWQEWQVAEKARELFIQLQSDEQLQSVLSATRNLYSSRYQRDRAAMQRGDETLSTVAADLTLLSNADTSLRQLQININLTRHGLNQLLGLQPNVRIHLNGSAALTPLSPSQFAADIAALPHRRADLLALQAGYQSQEETLRRAVLAQFPSVSAGVDLERDPVEGVNAFGPTVSITLPIFNRNRGQIAIQRATRAVLRQTYQAQLDTAVNQADQLWRATRIMAAQLNTLNAQLLRLKQTAAAAQQSFNRENLAPGLYINLETGFLSKQAEAIRLRAALNTAQSALRLLLGLPFS